MKKDRESKPVATYLSLVLLGTAAGLGGAYVLGLGQLNLQGTNNAVVTSTVATAAIPPGISTNSFIIDVVKESGPAVVRVNASRTVATEVPQSFDDPMFRRFFGVPNGLSIPDKQVQRGFGSGLIVSPDGIIYTNAHVIEGADEVTVTLKDGRTLKGKVLGGDKITDVAVVKIDAKDLPTIKIGNLRQAAAWRMGYSHR